MNKTTILIPTRNHFAQLFRLIPLLAKTIKGYEISVRVLDGSTTVEQAKDNERVCVENGIGYQRYDPDISFINRIYTALLEVDTYTVSLLDDEDVLSIRGLYDCVNFLYEHNDYSIAIGQYIAFDVDKERLRWFPCYTLRKTLDQDFAVERIKEAVGNYCAAEFYGVYKREALTNIFKELTDGNISDWASIELLASGLAVAQGKLKRLNSFYIGRGIIKTNVPFDYLRLAMGSIKNDITFVDILKTNKNILLKYLKSNNDELIEEILDYIFASYFFGKCFTDKAIEERYNRALYMAKHI